MIDLPIWDWQNNFVSRHWMNIVEHHGGKFVDCKHQIVDLLAKEYHASFSEPHVSRHCLIQFETHEDRIKYILAWA